MIRPIIIDPGTDPVITTMPEPLRIEDMDYSFPVPAYTQLLHDTVGNAGDDSDGFPALHEDLLTGIAEIMASVGAMDPDIDPLDGATDELQSLDAGGVLQAASDGADAAEAALADYNSTFEPPPASPPPPAPPAPSPPGGPVGGPVGGPIGGPVGGPGECDPGDPTTCLPGPVVYTPLLP